VGRQLLKNVRLFPGDVYLVDPSPAKEAGIPNYSSLKHIQKVPNLAFITVNPDAIPKAIAECVDHKIAAAVILSTVQAESEAAKACEQSIHAHRGSLAILRPNSLGLIRPLRNLNASYCSQTALPGKIAFASQSAALGAAILDWSLQEKIGFSAFVSGGAMHGVSWSDLLDYFGGDSSSRSILLYLESFGEVQSFFQPLAR
jgi:acetyltransferase